MNIRSRNHLIVNRLTRALIALATLSVVACSGGGGGGSDVAGGGPAAFATGTFFKLAEPGPDAANNGYPFNDSNSPHRLQQLYLASEINGSGFITHIGFRSSNALAAAVHCPNMTFRLGHSDLAALTDTFADNVETGEGSLQTVLNGTAVTIPVVGAGEYFDVPLTTPFYYNGVDNLVVDIERGAACGAEVDIDRATFTDRTLLGSAAGASGTLYDQLRFAKFTFAGGDNEQNFVANGVGTFGTTYPFNATMPRTQHLYLATEINGSGPITGIAFQLEADTTEQTYTATVRLGHSTLSELTTDFAGNYSSTPVTAANAVQFAVPVGIPAGGWVWVPLPHDTFVYNGTDNLIIDLAVSAASGNTQLRASSVTGRRVWNSNNAAATGNVDGAAYHLKLRFNGGTVDNIVSSGGQDSARWFTTSATGAIDQYLYRNTELGTGGAITRMACRLTAPDPSVATGFANFEVSLSHTSATALGTDVVANLPAPVIVFNGTYSLAAGLAAGDWIEVPFTTPFVYDALQNLVIQVKSDAGGTEHRCAVLGDATRFADRRLTAADRTAVVGSNLDHLKDLRLWISK